MCYACCPHCLCTIRKMTRDKICVLPIKTFLNYRPNIRWYCFFIKDCFLKDDLFSIADDWVEYEGVFKQKTNLRCKKTRTQETHTLLCLCWY